MDSLKGTVILFTPHTGNGLTRALGLCKNMESASKLFKARRGRGGRWVVYKATFTDRVLSCASWNTTVGVNLSATRLAWNKSDGSTQI